VSSTRSAAGCSRTSTATAAARTTRCTGSGTSCAPAPRTSPTGNEPGSRQRGPPTSARRGRSRLACAQQLRSAYHQDSHAEGRRIAEKILDSFTSCPIPEVARLGRTLTQWRTEFLGYFDTDGANNGGTEAINGLIELHRRIARGFRNRDNYRLRMLLIGGGLDPSPHTHR
jgi:hypothetical protein